MGGPGLAGAIHDLRTRRPDGQTRRRLPPWSTRWPPYRRMIDLLVQARKDARLTQAELGKRIAQRQTFVSKFELGERRLDVAEFVTVARAIGTDPCELIQIADRSGR